VHSLFEFKHSVKKREKKDITDITILERVAQFCGTNNKFFTIVEQPPLALYFPGIFPTLSSLFPSLYLLSHYT
jgi:hypothetical protein